jgi:hypothetical protein
MNRRELWLLSLTLVVALGGAWPWVKALALPAAAHDWTARPTTRLPPIIEPGDARWDQASPFHLPLHAGSHGPASGEQVELRALYDGVTIAFWARWPEAAPAPVAERFALIWHKDDLPGQRGQDCGTACHIARSDGAAGLQAVVPAFVPAGREDPLPTRAIWHAGVWTMTWSRPLHSPEARDIQFVDLARRYRVRAKVFLDLHHKPDLLSKDIYLIFAQAK